MSDGSMPIVFEGTDRMILLSKQVDILEPEFQDEYRYARTVWRAPGHLPEATLLDMAIKQRRRKEAAANKPVAAEKPTEGDAEPPQSVRRSRVVKDKEPANV